MEAQDPSLSTESNGGQLLSAGIVTLTLASTSVFLRVYTRLFLTNAFSVDDAVMLAGLANFAISCAFIFTGLVYGLGRHDKSLSQENEIEALKYQALATASYVSNMWLIKLSIGLFLYRLAVKKVYKLVLIGSILIVGIWSLSLFFWNVFQCSPVPAQWDYRILADDPKARCVTSNDVVDAAYALSVLSILSDWFYAIIPIPMIWGVKMTAQAKLTVVLVLGLGVFASVATLIRLKFLADLNDVEDILFAGTDAMVWTLVEPGLAITAASLVTIRPLLRKLKVRGFTSAERSGQSSDRYHDRAPKRKSVMPGFGSKDLTLVDVEQQGDTTIELDSNISASKVGRIKSPPPTTQPRASKDVDDSKKTSYRTMGKESQIALVNRDDIQRGREAPLSPRTAHVQGTWLEQESDRSSSDESGPPWSYGLQSPSKAHRPKR